MRRHVPEQLEFEGSQPCIFLSVMLPAQEGASFIAESAQPPAALGGAERLWAALGSAPGHPGLHPESQRASPPFLLCARSAETRCPARTGSWSERVETRGVWGCRGGPPCRQRWGSLWTDLISHRLGPAVYPSGDRAPEAGRKGLPPHQGGREEERVKAVTGTAPTEWPVGDQGCAGGRGREDREERESGRENPDVGARPAMAGGERARAWRAVVLGAGASGQNPVPPVAAGSRLRHGGQRRHRILSRPLLKAAFRKHRHPSDRRSGRLA